MTKSQISGLGKRVKDLRKAKKITQEQLAKQVGLTTSAIGRMEINKSMPSIEVFAQLCDILEVSADQLLFGKEPITHITQEDATPYNTKDEYLKKYMESLERENALLRERKK